jgi:hypothetical protein
MSAKKKHDDVVKPQIIDLDAEAVTEINETPETAPPEPEPPSEPAPVHSKSRVNNKSTLAIPLAALVAGALGGGWLYRDVLTTYLPSDHITALEQNVTTLQGDTTTALKSLTDKSQAEFAKIQATVETTKALQSAFEYRLAALETQSTTLAADLDQLKKRPIAPSGGAVDPTALDALKQKIATLESNIETLKKQATTPNPVLGTFSTLRATIDKGTPFSDQLAALTTAIPGLTIPNALSQAAVTGAPAPATLAEDLRRLSATLPAPTGDDASETTETGYWASFKKSLGNIISIKSAGPANWRSLTAQAADLVDQNKLAEAIDLLSKTGDPPEPVAAWLQKATARISVDAALASLAPTVMQHATAP